MILQKFRLAISYLSDKGHYSIEICLLLAGFLAVSATTDAAIAGHTQEATRKIIDLQNYASEPLTKLSDKQETTDSTVFTLVSPVVSPPFILDTLRY
jgi:hypothetical protein